MKYIVRICDRHIIPIKDFLVYSTMLFLFYYQAIKLTMRSRISSKIGSRVNMKFQDALMGKKNNIEAKKETSVDEDLEIEDDMESINTEQIKGLLERGTTKDSSKGNEMVP